jgi:cell division protein FtsQ
MTAPARPRRVVPAADRLEARAQAERSARRGRRLHRVRQVLVVLLPVLAVAWVLFASTWLAVDRVQVSGTSRLTPAQVVAAAGVEVDTPLARVDTGAVEGRVAALDPVADVAVRRSWPGTLSVQVTERAPVAAVPRGGAFTLVDRDGVPFATDGALPPGVVRLEVARPGPADPATGAALAVHAELPAALRAKVSVVKAPSPSSVVLVLGDGRQVVWGRPGGAATKAGAVLALLGKPGTVFDVSGEGVVVVK